MTTSLPNILTYTRILAVPVVAGLMFVASPVGAWLALAVYAYACLTDFLDGYLARAWSQQSKLGTFLDPIADKLLIASVLLVLVETNRVTGLAIIPAVVILCREILVSGLREFLATAAVSVPVTRLAKWKTGLQMFAIGFLVVGPFGPNFGPVTTNEIGILGLWVAAVLTLITGYDYLRAGLAHISVADAASHNEPAKPAKGPDNGTERRPG